jgi:hypothetical protein
VLAGSLIGVVEMAFDFFDAGWAAGFGPQGVEDGGDRAGSCDGQQRVSTGDADQQGEATATAPAMLTAARPGRRSRRASRAIAASPARKLTNTATA